MIHINYDKFNISLEHGLKSFILFLFYIIVHPKGVVIC